MAGQADGSDDAPGLQLPGVVQHAAGAHRLPVGQGVHIVDHADLRVIGLQPAELIGKARLHLVQIPGALVLPVLPDGAQVGLEDEFLPPAPQRAAQAGAELRVGGVEVDAVDPARLHGVHHFPDLRIALAHKAFAPHADLADQQACAAQLTILHCAASLSFLDTLPHPAAFCNRRPGGGLPAPEQRRALPGHGASPPEQPAHDLRVPGEQIAATVLIWGAAGLEIVRALDVQHHQPADLLPQ